MKKKIYSLFLLAVITFSCSSDDDDGNPCQTPTTIGANNITNTTASVFASSDVTSSIYEYQYGPLGFTLGSGIRVSSSQQFTNIQNLEPETSYEAYARVYCNTTSSFSDWAGPYAFVTSLDNPFCEDPTFFILQDITDTTADFSWGNSFMDGWEIEYGVTGYTLGEGTIQGSNNDTGVDGPILQNLTANTTYDFYVRNSCGDNGYSSWVGPITATTDEGPFNPDCLDPYNFISLGTNIDSSNGFPVTQFRFTWDHDVSQNSWEIGRVLAGESFSSNNSNTIATSFDNVILNYSSNVVSGQAYDFYVRANCGGSNGFSAFIGPVTVTAP